MLFTRLTYRSIVREFKASLLSKAISPSQGRNCHCAINCRRWKLAVRGLFLGRARLRVHPTREQPQQIRQAIEINDYLAVF